MTTKSNKQKINKLGKKNVVLFKIKVNYARIRRVGESLWPEGSRFEPRKGNGFCDETVRTGSEAHPASCTVDTGKFPEGRQLGRGVDHPPHVALRLRMSGTIPPLSLFPCMAVYLETFTCNGFNLLSNVASTVTLKMQREIFIFLFYSMLA